jgi:hypothetical protein
VEPYARRTVIQLVTAQIAEIRLDIEGARQGKLRLGLVLTIATVVVTTSGWPPVDAVQRALYLVLVALPCTGIGIGLMVDELMRARADRLGRQRADDREIDALRARIVAAAEERTPIVVREVSTTDVSRRSAKAARTVAQAAPPASGRSGGRRLIGGRGAAAPFRTGFLGLR